MSVTDGMVPDSFERVAEAEQERQRVQYDQDDRVRCVCIARHDLGRKDDTQCLNQTRHPSGRCVDCRLVPGGPK